MVELLDAQGFAGCYELVYLPIDFQTENALGYAFISLSTPDAAERLRNHFEGFTAWPVESGKICSVSWSDLEGLQAHVDRYRNSNVQHPSVPDKFKPALYKKDGERIEFPAPTKNIRPPRFKTLAAKIAREDERTVSDMLLPSVKRSSVMMRNIPSEFTRDILVELLDAQGFAGCYDLVYLPMDFHTENALGYAFISLSTPDAAERLRNHFEGFAAWPVESDRVCSSSWSDIDGLQAHVERYRNSNVQHASVPDKFKPALYNKDGERIEFPAPTKSIRPPRFKTLAAKIARGPIGAATQTVTQISKQSLLKAQRRP